MKTIVMPSEHITLLPDKYHIIVHLFYNPYLSKPKWNFTISAELVPKQFPEVEHTHIMYPVGPRMIKEKKVI